MEKPSDENTDDTLESPEENPADAPRHSFNWNDVKRDISERRPREEDFIDCYEESEIAKDVGKVRKYQREMGIKAEVGVSDSQVLEYTTIRSIEEMDWFGEIERGDELFRDERGQEIIISPTAEADDYLNHIDAICVIKNADSKYVPVPFALDMTYNTNSDDLTKKISHKHPLKNTGNLPGFATAKYFEDTFSYGKPVLKKGRIEIMPRFVIGYSPDLANHLTKVQNSISGWDTLQRDELSTKAKWCVLRELKLQSEQMLKMLEGYSNDHETIFGRAYSEANALDKYFTGAIEAAEKKDAAHQDWIEYADSDEVTQEILAHFLASPLKKPS